MCQIRFSVTTLTFLAVAMLLPILQLSLSLAIFLSFVLTSPQYWRIKLYELSFCLILSGSNNLSWMSFANDIIVRRSAMFHAAFSESKLLAQGGYQTLTKSTVTLREARAHPSTCTHTHTPARKNAPVPTSVSAVLSFTCLDFSCATKLQLVL